MRISQKSRSFPTLEERCDQSCESAGLALSHQECEGFESNEIIGGALRQISQSECWVCPAVLSYIMTDNYNWVFLSAQASFYKAEDLLVNRIIPIRPLSDSQLTTTCHSRLAEDNSQNDLKMPNTILSIARCRPDTARASVPFPRMFCQTMTQCRAGGEWEECFTWMLEVEIPLLFILSMMLSIVPGEELCFSCRQQPASW